MKFFAIAALAAVAAAQYGTPAEETCSQVTITVTQTLKHTPSAPAAHVPTGPAPYPSKSVQTPLGGTAYPTASVPKPSGTGSYSAPPTQFTGAASSLKAGGVVAAGAIAALFL